MQPKDQTEPAPAQVQTGKVREFEPRAGTVGKDDQLDYRERHVFPNGAIYSGTMACRVTLCAQFLGQWKDEMRHGYGTQTWPDGAKYEGYWKDNKTYGKGKFWHANGDFFEGESVLRD